ncbi:MAG TPA: ATP-binding protein [Thermoanaerobaculia bacterium]|jgi:hypothetical protein|nr:ATP-binding protein [Thermoanaerobaculia bacterium]
MLSQELLNLVSQGESETVELKARVPPDGVIAKHLAAFANSKGGVLVIGAAQDGRVTGLSDAEARQAVDTLRTVGESLLSKPPDIGVDHSSGRTMVYAVISPRGDSASPILTANGELFERHGTSVRKLSVEDEMVALHPGVRALRGRSRSCTVFVAMSFREEENPSLVDYFRAMERAAKATNLPIRITRIDLLEGDYDIPQRLMQQIDAADIVLADFTMSARNVYFELGYARGVKKRVIQTAHKNENLEFDIRNWRTLFYRNATELEDRLVAELTAAYAELNPDGDGMSPLGAAKRHAEALGPGFRPPSRLVCRQRNCRHGGCSSADLACNFSSVAARADYLLGGARA